VHTRERKSARDRERRRERERYVPEPDVGLDVRDGTPRSGLAYPAEKEEVFPVRVLDPDVLDLRVQDLQVPFRSAQEMRNKSKENSR
jgi:hypothetical protein